MEKIKELEETAWKAIGRVEGAENLNYCPEEDGKDGLRSFPKIEVERFRNSHFGG